MFEWQLGKFRMNIIDTAGYFGSLLLSYQVYLQWTAGVSAGQWLNSSFSIRNEVIRMNIIYTAGFSSLLPSSYQVCLQFICVKVLGPSQPNGVMPSTVSLPNHMFTGQA